MEAGFDLLRLSDACDSIGQASGALGRLNGQVQMLTPLLGALDAVGSVGQQARSQATALEAGTEVSTVAASLCKQMSPLADLTRNGDGSGGSLTAALRSLIGSRQNLLSAANELEKAGRSVEGIDEAHLDESARGGVKALRERTPKMVRSLREAAMLLGLLDGPQGRRFLVVSQNPDEIRATGGFIGSAGVVEIKEGAIKLVEYGSSRLYDTPGNVRAVPPAPFQRYLGPNYWVLAGANWSPSFPDVARQLSYFLGLSRPGVKVDGVIAVDQHALGLLLEATGPVDVPEFGERVDAANLQATFDKHVHVDGDEYERKQFTSAVTAAVLRRVTTADASALPKLAKAVRAGLDNQHIIISVEDPNAAAVFARKRWDGRLMKAERDYLMLVDSEVSFSKQSQEVARDAEYRLDLTDPDGPTATLAVTYTNNSKPRNGVPFRPVYASWLRAYVPAGAQLVGGQGFAGPVSTYQECGRTVIAGEVQVATGQRATATLTYRLPSSVAANGYDLVLQQQPGVPPGRTSLYLKTSAGEAAVGTPAELPRQRHAHWGLDAASAPALRDAPLPENDAGDCGTPLVQAQPIPAPTAFEIPSLGVKAPVVPLGIGKDGVMEAPDGPDAVGWYQMSARAGQPGNLVMSAHLDWRDRLAVFANLRQLKTGDKVVVRGEDGRDYTYAVESNTSYAKDEAPMRDILKGTEEAVATLISCDGTFDQKAKDYSHRRIVRAKLVG